MYLEWWHWMVLGLGLGMLELVVASFFVIWFGLGALLVGFAMLAFPAMAAGVFFPWLHVLAPVGSTAYRMLNALAPVGTALLAFGVTWALRTTAAADAARIVAAQARRGAGGDSP